MNKKRFAILLLSIVALLIGGQKCQLGGTQYDIINVQPEDRYVDSGKNTRVFFEVLNNAETTLVSRIETKINNTCFSKVEDKSLDGIPPSGKTSSYVYIQTVSSNYPYGSEVEKCKGSIFTVTLILKDVSGQILTSDTTEISIPK